MIRGSAVRSSLKVMTTRRLLSSAVSKFTTLSNGVTVATEANPAASSSTVGVYFGAGSRSEHPYNNGVSALATNLLAGQLQDGILLGSSNSKEVNGIVAQTTNDNVNAAGKLVASIISNASEVAAKADFQSVKNALIAEAAAVESTPQAKILSHLDASAFQGYSLGLPTLGTTESISGLELDDVTRHLQRQINGSNTVIAASGKVDHDALVDAIESSLKVEAGLKPQVKPATFLGSEVRMRDDTLPKAYVSIAVNGEGLNSPGYYLAKVAAAVFGSFDKNTTLAHYTSPKLATIVQEYDIVDKYTHFSTSYSDAGLWGFSSEISNITRVDEFVHFALKEWNRLSISISDAEVARAKAQVKVALAGELNSTTAVANDLGSKLLLVGHRNSLADAFQKIDAITTKDIKAWGQAKVWDNDIVVSGTGQIEALMDYGRNRNEMAMMRW
ncbi:ubiquinol-cytochrome c reductase core subunit 1 [Spathaspora passalidarum NRRL Y-27907]|uniref:Ubiquinol-cytochrome c reductase core subunit 1 n=1 Tax=Spathaspora passalidarum (strain NRRL Y-27907 / 11-Y1) TaxID=619300 RepID=G3AST4_SPAPN|nr:ubiquinol-cytochrome c reductase core subunit 1 [Spathaspora passalidarum NRRL Y-27907]EGW31148.1 ubiquinol-cytochrome c reductase core subunit 1 [Spathaspora passalidarum NRRL Y-27907]